MIKLIDVEKSDWNLILELRNDYFKNFYEQKKPLEINEHFDYLEKQSKNPNFYHWIIQYDDKKVGYARILDNDVGIMIKKNFQNKGIASNSLKLVEEKAKLLKILKLKALVKFENHSSKKIFQKNNYKLKMYWLEKEI